MIDLEQSVDQLPTKMDRCKEVVEGKGHDHPDQEAINNSPDVINNEMISDDDHHPCADVPDLEVWTTVVGEIENERGDPKASIDVVRKMMMIMLLTTLIDA